MVVKKETYYEKNFLFLDWLQYLFAIIITILFLFSLIPFFYGYISKILVIILFIQLILSILRLKLLNIFLELILLSFALISFINIIPIVFIFIGYILRFFGLLFGIIEMLSFKNSKVFKIIEIVTTNKFRRKTVRKSKKSPEKVKTEKFQEAKFKEK